MTSAAGKKNKRSQGAAAVGVRPYRRLHSWAIATLLETHAIIECAEHGHIRDRGSWAHGWTDAKTIATSHPFTGATSQQCIAEIDEIMMSVGDVCPECN